MLEQKKLNVILITVYQCCVSKYIEFGSRSRNLALFGSGSRSGSRVMQSILKAKIKKNFRGNNFLARLDRVDRLRRSERRQRHRRRRRRHDRLVRPVPILLKRGKKQFSIKRSRSATQSKMADLQLFQARSFSVEMYSGNSG